MPELTRREDWFDSMDQNHLTPIIIWLASGGLLLIGILFLVVFLCKRRFKRQRAARERKELEAGMKKVLSFPEREERRLTGSIETAWGSMSASGLVLGAELGGQEKIGRVEMEGSGWEYAASRYSQPNHIHLPVHHTPDDTRPRDGYRAQGDKVAQPATGNRLSEPFEIVEVENNLLRSASVKTTRTINTVYRFHYPTPLTPPGIRI
jgi:hypothetical protein